MISSFRFIATVIATVLSTSIFAQLTFQQQAFVTGSFPVFQNCVVDMNGDHLDDIVGISDNVLVIAAQQEDGTFVTTSHFQNFQNTADWSICAGDIDANGFNDLIIGDTEFVSFVYANNNGSAYTEEAKPNPIFSQRSTFADIDNDGHLDAFICHDVNQNHPYRNDGNGNLTLDQSLITTPANTPGNYESVFVDYDNDGDLDMHLTKCVQNALPDDPNRINLLYNNDGNGNYTEVAAQAGLADSDQSWVSMFEDFDGDGDFDVFTLNHEVSNKLMLNNGDGTFTDVTEGSGLEDSFLGAVLGLAADFDNDGDIDILRNFPSQFYFNNGDMTFTTETVNFFIGSMGDLNNDGYMDIVEGHDVYYNQGNANHWLRINTVGRESNRNGIGAKVEAYGDFGMKLREVRAGRSWAPMTTLGTHIGLGPFTEIDSLVVKWPSGLRSVILNPAVDQVYTIDELDCPTEFINVETVGTLQICDGESVLLTAPAGFQYLWSTDEVTQSINITESGGYNVTVTRPGGCTSFSKVINVENLADSLEITAPDGLEFCGAPIRLQADTDQPVVWSTGETSQTIFVREEGEFFVTSINACGNQVQSESIIIESLIVDPPMAQDTIVPVGTDSLILEVQGGFVLWYAQEVGGAPLQIGNTFLVEDITENDTIWIQLVTPLASGQECLSERVPLSITVETLSADDFDTITDLVIYPNPAKGHIHVSVSDQLLTGVIIRDISGRAIKNYVRSSSNLYNLDGLEAGVYLLEIYLGNKFATRKIVVAE